MAQALFPVIPQNITVHLGAPDEAAENVTLPFVDYIKNVASSEIYPTWPESSLRANIYAIISYALNRVYTEWYPSRGYDFDITNTTRYDQAFVKDRDIFANISEIVDEIFNDYVIKQGRIEPYFTQFCNGTTSKCDGLSQWGTVSLANEGLTPFEILQRYYGNDIGLVNNAPVEDITESYPGVPLRVGAAGNNVKIIQEQLNRISRNYPAIPQIAQTNGVFGLDTEAAVRTFQEVFDLEVNGIVDKATWYRIKRYYVGVKSLAELTSEGVTINEASLPFERELSVGASGIGVRTLQYYLSVLAYFNPSLKTVKIDGVFGPATLEAVKEYQRYYGLEPTGVVRLDTWVSMARVYAETVASLPEGYQGNSAKLYPGYVLSEGMRGQNITDLQTYLSFLGRNISALPELPVTGYFGQQTKEAVEEFQRLYGLTESGTVGAVTWNTIASEYDALNAQI